MKTVFNLMACMFIFSCSSSSTTETVEQEHTPKMEAAAKLQFSLAKTDYNSWVQISMMNQMGLSESQLETKSKAHDNAKEKFENIIAEYPKSSYHDSAEIYLDSMFIHGNNFLKANLNR